MANDAIETVIIATLQADMINIRALIPTLITALNALKTCASQSVNAGQAIDKGPIFTVMQQVQGLNDILNNGNTHVDQWNNYEAIKAAYGGH